MFSCFSSAAAELCAEDILDFIMLYLPTKLMNTNGVSLAPVGMCWPKENFQKN
jgi:hypothetical protein